jgi:predicted RNA-binding Zn-ribbon protein involved in translation (DUF1610 family)
MGTHELARNTLKGKVVRKYRKYKKCVQPLENLTPSVKNAATQLIKPSCYNQYIQRTHTCREAGTNIESTDNHKIKKNFKIYLIRELDFMFSPNLTEHGMWT